LPDRFEDVLVGPWGAVAIRRSQQLDPTLGQPSVQLRRHVSLVRDDQQAGSFVEQVGVVL
jgi:hypothetical protein